MDAKLSLRRWRIALGLAAALLCTALPVRAETQAFYTEDDLRLLYDEAIAIGEHTYVFYLYITGDEDTIRKFDATLGTDAKQRASLKAAMPSLQAQKMRAYAMPEPLRLHLRGLVPGETTPLFKADRTRWAIAELKAVEYGEPMSPFETLKPNLARLAGMGALPQPAAVKGDPELLERFLIGRVKTPREFDQLPPGIDVDRPLTSGNTLLQRALRRDQVELVKAVLTRGADPNLCLLRVCPLQIALQSKTNALLFTTLLLEKGAKPDLLPGVPGQDTVMVQAARDNRLDLVKALLDKGADANGGASVRHPLQLALDGNNLELMRLLLDKGADVHGRKLPSSPLHLALAKGQREMVQLLLDKGADGLQSRPLPGSSQPGVPLMVALEAQQPELAAWFRETLLKHLGSKGAYQWSAWVEQEVLAPPPPVDPKNPKAAPAGPLVQVIRTPLRPGGRVTLNRERFTLHLRMPAQGLRAEASTGDTPFAELVSGNLAAPLFNRTRVRKGGNVPGPLLVSDARARAMGAGSLMAWTPTKKDCDSLQKTAEGAVCVKIIDVVRLESGGANATNVPLEKSTMPEIDLVLGVGIDYSVTQGDFVNPVKATLVFK
ncbi:MAG: ankyrin repeat domain protein [Moraxellaceae bacterium]|jgi:ankyrin repeat protein|nr:ankyrin repeat domain protein [Moraxellaceae bacterium]